MVTLQVTAPDGGPLAPRETALSAGTAAFVLVPTQAGSYALRVACPGEGSNSARLQVRPGPPSQVEAYLSTPFPRPGQALRLRAVVLDRWGNLVPGRVTVKIRTAGLKSASPRRVSLASGEWIPLGTADQSGGYVYAYLSAPGLAPRRLTLPWHATAQPASLLRGASVFLSYWVARDESPALLVRRALTRHVRALLVEVAVPGSRFFGQPGLDRLLGPAHQAGLAVLAWVPANLRHPVWDAVVARAALQYRTPLGQGVDGLAADLEGTMAPPVLERYFRQVRSVLSSAPGARVLAAVVEPPDDPAVQVPYRLLARYAHVLMPMDYWQMDESTSTYTAAYDEVATSVSYLRMASPTARVVPILQGYDPFTPGGAGSYSPSLLAEQGAARAAAASGAWGAAFFQWGSLTPSEWRAVSQVAQTVSGSPQP
jgi:hypothetical protein